jgi:16S rRNA (uracil1498-N3)-methyltransferase
MSLHRFFVDEAVSTGRVVVRGSDLHHLRDVLRLRAGDEVAVADPTGEQAVARVLTVGEDEAALEVVTPLPAVSDPDVTLFQGLSRGPKMDLVVQKATEIGVRRIVPVVMSRSVVKLDAKDRGNRAERWRRIALEAAKQSQRATVPGIDEPVTLEEAAALLETFDVVLVPWEEAGAGGAPGVGEALRAATADRASRAAIVIGPEGGMEDGEVARLRAAGAVAVSLGPTILRTETAAIVAVALTSFCLGGLAGERA